MPSTAPALVPRIGGIAPFATNGYTGNPLGQYIARSHADQARVGDVKCDGKDRCIHTIDVPSYYGITPLDKTKMTCERKAGDKHPNVNEYGLKKQDHFAGSCKPDKECGDDVTYLVQCADSTKNYVYVHYGKHSATIKGYGTARGLFSSKPVTDYAKFKKHEHITVDVHRDVYVWCARPSATKSSKPTANP